MKLTDQQANTAITAFYNGFIAPHISVYGIHDDSYLNFLLGVYKTLTTNSDYPEVPNFYYNSPEYGYTSVMRTALDAAHRGYMAHTTNNKDFGAGTYGDAYYSKYLTPSAEIAFLLPHASSDDRAAIINAIDSKAVSSVDLAAAFALTLTKTATPSAVDILSLVTTAAGEPFSFDETASTTLNGTSGVDTLSLKSMKSHYKITHSSDDNKIVAKSIFSDFTATATALDYERVKFSDGNFVAFDIDGAAGQAYRLYKAAFDRVPDKEGLGYWINQMDNGESLASVAHGFVLSEEFLKLNGAAPANVELASSYYQHVLGRAPDQAGLDYWVSQLDNNILNPSAMLISFSESAENKIALTGQIQGGIEYSM